MTFLLLLLAIVPHDGVSREAVDLVELNHFYDEHGRLVFDQVIFYDWDLTRRERKAVRGNNWRYQVRAWRLVKEPGIIPVRDWRNGGYRSLWFDDGQLRDIKAREFRESWTQEDPELYERLFLPKDRRKELKK